MILGSAFRNSQAVFYVFSAPRWQVHAVTSWGMELSDEDYVKYLLYGGQQRRGKRCAGNDSPSGDTLQATYLFEFSLMPYIPNSIGDFKYRIRPLYAGPETGMAATEMKNRRRWIAIYHVPDDMRNAIDLNKHFPRMIYTPYTPLRRLPKNLLPTSSCRPAQKWILTFVYLMPK